MIHKFVSAKSDGGDPTLVQASNWNALHIRKVSSQSTNYTITTSDDLLHGTGGVSGITYTLPDPTTCAGQLFEIVKVDSGAGVITVNPHGTEKICTLGNLAGTSYSLVDAGQRAVFISDGTNWWVAGAN